MRGVTMKWLGLCLAVLGLLAACGGGEDLTKAKVRLVNASGYSALDMVVGDQTKLSSVAYGGTENYVDVDPGETGTELRRPGGSTALLSFTPALAKKRYYTVLAYGGEGALRSLLLDDNSGTPASGKTLLRILNAARDAGAVDVYLTGTDELLSDTVPLQPAAAVGTVNGYSTLSAGTRRLRVTAAGSKTDLRLDVLVALAGERAMTLVVTPSAGGVMVNALLLTEQGGIARQDTTQARVRVAAAVADSGSVAASVGGIALATGIGAPSVGAYKLVTAGSVTPVLAVNGVALATSAVTLAAGADYTLMVYGAVDAPVAAWLGDDNRPAIDATKAKLRLVHGVGDLSGALALSVDFVPVATGVARGTASVYYSDLAPTITADTLVTAPGLASLSALDRTFAAGATYTLFVVGSTAVPTDMLIKDR